jgi:hypothetical protein
MSMVWIAGVTVTVGNQNSTYTFSSIPQTFTHLQMRVFARSTNGSTSDYFGVPYNGDNNNSNYYQHALNGNGSTATSTGQSTVGSIDIAGGTSTANVFCSAIFDILDYTNTNKNKVRRIISGADFNGSGNTVLVSGLYLGSLNAITSISVFTSTNFAIGSRFDLYGITTSQVTGA